MGVFSIGKVLIDSLFRKPATLMYPVIPREWEEMTRGAVGIDIEGCVLCGMCERACPTNAIKVDRKAATWSIERMNCVQCRGCVDNCPPKCLIMEQKYTEPGVEKVIDTFDIPKKEKPAKKDAAGGAAAAAPADGDGPLTCDTDTCVYCGICAKECPTDALEVSRKPEKVWKVDEDSCVKCGVCIDKCPKDSLSFGGGLNCDVDSCVFCSACAEACPVDAIDVGDSSWEVDKDNCIECGACLDQCPVGCLSMGEGEAAEEAEAPADKEEPKSAPKAEQTKTLRDALEMDAETREKVEGYIAQVKDALVNEFKLAEEAALEAIEEENLKGQLARFPFLLKKEAKETAERIKKD
jgi:formate hydrogenlyase subunit 6/NADH:ubiquinone oxidoreductase subunit I